MQLFVVYKWLAEASECEYKVSLEERKPKSWLKTVSAFANGLGGIIVFGIDDVHRLIGLVDAQKDAELISQFIKNRIAPLPNFVLTPQL